MLPLPKGAAVLRHAVRALRPHLLLGRLLPSQKSAECYSRDKLGGRTCLELQGRPFLAAREKVVRMLEGLAVHCVTHWQRRLSRLLHVVPLADFLGGFFPAAQAGKAPLRPYQRAQRQPCCLRAPPAERSSAAQRAATQGLPSSRRRLGKRHGSTGGLCPTNGAPSRERYRTTGQGVANCCRYRHTRHP